MQPEYRRKAKRGYLAVHEGLGHHMNLVKMREMISYNYLMGNFMYAKLNTMPLAKKMIALRNLKGVLTFVSNPLLRNTR